MNTNALTKYLDIKAEVKEALDNNRPVVALESTIISHGFNYPENLECARECERIIREQGATPATIAIIDGRIKVGLNDEQIQYLATNREITKCSRRDIPSIIAQKKDGATTVATTMIIAHMAGISIFATGGIGGVHRGAQKTFDISADLDELAKTSVGVVCSGAKSILDIPLTREYLETKGVPVIGYQVEDFPEFYTRKSSTKVDYKFDTYEEIARMLLTKQQLGLEGGVVIGNAIPEENEMDYDFIHTKTEEALADAEKQGIKGKATTPFLLAKLHDITEGKSVAANKALVFNNSRVAAGISKALCELKNQ